MLLLSLPACFGGGERERDRRPQPIRPRADGPITLQGPPSRETEQCFVDLSRANVRFSPLPDRDYGGGCVVIGAVQLIDFGLPTSGLKSMRCPLARTFIAWLRNGVAPAARELLGTDLRRVQTYGTYSCRGIVGGNVASAGRVSQHGLANAVDIAGFELADGRRITIERDWHGSDPAIRDFLRIIHRSACKRFTTVLSPEYNAAHYNHLHFDMGGKSFCK